jgi:hypothetical protein
MEPGVSEELQLRVPRFRPSNDWFVSRRSGAIHEMFVWSHAERLMRLMYELSEHLEPEVDLSIESRRDGRVWHGSVLPLNEVRSTIEMLVQSMSRFGGVELSVYTPDDQLTITSSLGLVIYARSDRWVYLLEAMGFTERANPPQQSWDADGAPLDDAPELTRDLELAVRQLKLTAG